MKNKIHFGKIPFNIRFAVFFSFGLLCFPFLTLAQNPDREKTIEKEFDCISQQQGHEVGWEDVCYSAGTPGDSFNKKRQQLIDNTLNTIASQQASQENNDDSDEYAQSDVSQEQYSNNQIIAAPNENFSNKISASKIPVPAKTYSYGINFKKHQFEFGPEIFSYVYKEPNLSVDIRGVMVGFSGLYEFRPQKSENILDEIISVYKLDGRFAYGSLDYSDTSGFPTVKDNNIDNYSLEFRGAAGYDFFINERNVVTPYLGLGFRYLYYGGGSAGRGNYDRVSHYLYVPFGFDFLSQLDKGWQWGANFEADVLVWGRQDSYLSDIDNYYYGDIRNRQKRGLGLRGSVKFIRKADSVNFVFEPFIRYWHINNSDTTYFISNGGFYSDGYSEPNNNTTEAGLKVAVQY